MASSTGEISLTKLKPEKKSIENGIADISLGSEEEPCVSEINDRMMLGTPRIVKPIYCHPEEVYRIFSEDFNISECKPADVLSRVHTHVEESLMNRKWLAIWKGGIYRSSKNFLQVLVQVDDVSAAQAHVSLFDPPVMSMSGVPFQVIEAHLEELNHTVDLTELYPVAIPGYDKDQEKSMEDLTVIATLLGNYRFFAEYIHRDWDDDDDDREQPFDSYLQSRLRLCFDIANGCVPTPVVARYNHTMAKYIARRKELLEYQSLIQSHGEPSTSEAIECWRKYYEVLMLSGLLQIWESLQLKVEGPCFPRVLRKKKGKRPDGSTVTHLVTRVLTPSMLKSFPDDTEIMQHESPLFALRECCEGDQIILLPGTYSGEGFHELTESVTIKGMTNQEEVIVKAPCCDDLFVNVSSSNVAIENITFEHLDNTEAILRVDSGHATVKDCCFKCNGSGVIVHTGAKLTMMNSKVTGVEDVAVEVLPGSTVVLENNIFECGQDDESSDPHNELEEESEKRDQKGAVHLYVTDPPSIRMKNNKIHRNEGSALTIGKHVYSEMNLFGYERRIFPVDLAALSILDNGEGEKCSLKKGLLNLIFGDDGLNLNSSKAQY